MSSPSDPTPSSSAAAAAAVTVASTPHPQTLTLALPIQTTTNPNPNPNSSSSADSWSESATSALIDAWGELYLQLSRGHLKQQHWQQISSILSKSDAQCKNRIDSLKKKYKSEKSKISSGQSPLSTWPYFHRLDILIGPTLLKSLPPHPHPHPFPQKTRTQTTTIPAATSKKQSLSPDPAAARVTGDDGDGGGGESEFGELTRAVARFGEVYERVEKAKASWAVEMERARMGFVRELEMKRMEFFVKTQMELSSVGVVDGNKKEMVVMPRRKKRSRRQD